MAASAPISVVLPHHNRSGLIGRAVDSIRHQTLQPLEILIVDDASELRHRTALQQYRACAQILHLDKNVGAAQARNTGMNAAKGEFIAFLDDDDEWLPNKLELQWNVICNNPTLDAVAGPMIIQYDHGCERLLLSHSPEIMTVQTALEGTPALYQTLLVRTTAMRQLGGLDPRFRIMDDQDFWIRFTAAGLRAFYMAQPLARLDRSDIQRLSTNSKKYTAEELAVVNKHYALYDQVYGKGAARRYRSKIIRRAGIRTGGLAGRLLYIQGCLLGTEWGSLMSVLATGKMTEVPYAKA